MRLPTDLLNAARRTHKREHRELATQLARQINLDINGLLISSGNIDAMKALVGSFTRGIRLLAIMSEPAPPTPRTDVVDLERKAA